MKIIDNKRDYYDYLVGIYGMDEKIVYDRRGSLKFQYLIDSGQIPVDESNIIGFFVRIGYLVYEIFKDDEGKWICPSEISAEWSHPAYPNPDRVDEKKAQDYNQNEWSSKKGWINTEITPIAIGICYADHGSNWKWISNPILSSFPGVASFIDPQVIWDEVYNFISSRKERPIIDTRTDVQKAESHGFDKKTSFRKM